MITSLSGDLVKSSKQSKHLLVISYCLMFSHLCLLFIFPTTGEKGAGEVTGKPLHYKGTKIHRVVKDFIIQGGDFSAGLYRTYCSIHTVKNECVNHCRQELIINVKQLHRIGIKDPKTWPYSINYNNNDNLSILILFTSHNQSILAC